MNYESDKTDCPLRRPMLGPGLSSSLGLISNSNLQMSRSNKELEIYIFILILFLINFHLILNFKMCSDKMKVNQKIHMNSDKTNTKP